MTELRSRISGCGSAAASGKVSNIDLEHLVDTSDEWIRTRTGIEERRVTTGERASELAAKAARKAIKAAGITAKDIDLVVVGTVTPDMVFPSTACFVAAALGVRAGVPAFDVAAACSGFIYALDIADKYIMGGGAKNVLVIGVDFFSRIVDWTDRSTCVLFGDGAGAVVLSATRGKKSALLSSHIHSDGRKWETLYAPNTPHPNPFEKKPPGGSTDRVPTIKMNGSDTFKLAVRTMTSAAREVIELNGLKPADIKLLIPHQANVRIMKAAQQRLGLSDEQVFSNIEKYGNTSAASIPMAIDEAHSAGLINKGDIIILVAFGGGLTWASAAIRW
jgi:3-oxoacyl-[acyl-carrier-protein] synthase-3